MGVREGDSTLYLFEMEAIMVNNTPEVAAWVFNTIVKEGKGLKRDRI